MGISTAGRAGARAAPPPSLLAGPPRALCAREKVPQGRGFQSELGKGGAGSPEPSAVTAMGGCLPRCLVSAPVLGPVLRPASARQGGAARCQPGDPEPLLWGGSEQQCGRAPKLLM